MANKPTLNVYFDCETSVDDGIVYPYLIGWTTDLNTKKFEYSEKPHTGFLLRLVELNKKYTLHLWAHNCDYDLMSIYPTILAGRFNGHKIEYTQKSGSNTFIAFKFSHKKLSFKCYDTWTWNKTYSLADYCKLLGIEDKGSIDYNKKTLI